MSDVLVLNVPMFAHVNPTVPLVAELVRRGERVTYYATEPFRATVEASGCAFRVYRDADFSFYDRPDKTLFEHVAVLMDAAVAILAQLKSDMPRVDYILHDALCPWGRLFGRLMSVPTISTSVCFAFHPLLYMHPTSLRYFFATLPTAVQDMRHFRRASATFRRTYGIDPGSMWELVTNKGQMNLVFTAKHMQPLAGRFDDTYRFIGASISDARIDTNGLFARAENRPIIYVSCGTQENHKPDIFRMCIDAFRESDYYVIVSIGSRVRAQDLGPVPPHIRLMPYVPQLEVLRRASFFISHGSLSSINESLMFGVPLLIHPATPECDINARQIAKFGAARVLKSRELNPATVRRIVDEMLATPAYAGAVAALRDALVSAGGARQGADEIQQFKARLGIR